MISSHSIILRWCRKTYASAFLEIAARESTRILSIRTTTAITTHDSTACAATVSDTALDSITAHTASIIHQLLPSHILLPLHQLLLLLLLLMMLLRRQFLPLSFPHLLLLLLMMLNDNLSHP
jgi:hypothetical protein